MGSPVSAIIAKLYMEDFEEQVIPSAPTAPRSGNVMLTTLYHLKTK